MKRDDSTRLRTKKGRYVAECEHCCCPEGCACEGDCSCGTVKVKKATKEESR